MIPEIIITKSKYYFYYCKSVIPIESYEDMVKQYQGKIHLCGSNSCHYYCKNQECEIKKNIVDLQNEYFKHNICSICSERKIDWGFFLVINRLKKEGLLPENFTYICCYCYKEIGDEKWLKLMK